MKPTFLFLLVFLCANPVVKAQEYRHHDEQQIWPGGAPGSNPENWPWEGYKEEWRIDSATNKEMVIFVTEPTVQVFLPPREKNTGAAVVVCPGGGYNIVVIGKEGYDIAQRLNDMGIAVIVLKYRHYNIFAARDDTQRAIRYTRFHSREWNIDPDKIGLGGFSAGGHLSIHAAANLNPPAPEGRKPDAIDSVSDRPDFLMLGYPATNMPKGVEIGAAMPPAFIVVAADDPLMPASVDLFKKLRSMDVPAELHIYQTGGHGFGAGTPECHCSSWMDLFRNWLETNKVISSE